MQNHRKLVPAEAVELVARHGPDAVLIARMYLVQAREANDELRTIHWQTLVEAAEALLAERNSDPGRRSLAG
ncbi:conserved hypothetical protein [Gluconacetobacter diazotrophicus PA1 5]|uniref:Uncharacterized protein n=1 Tax=Gluconacetobacter diazotrophicus (strain ATCC 49037 / DSM 5601 / CCUG 37298 / CIP 103539 / LMG 7603 / PAl5) TaxID=272568 RepID=A9HFK7_GLUDA|nr:hypothetical protein [Gluconacetobacter diazotrophicus]ACI51892.1 conserved hypothetical protein [Gluconacetobacter diazotrophicus PA1 5]TWB11237.1 hypothetical protein FBZ86_101264 [Gluconacetobacter diazotrophicus]CAP55376.1 hypothetical protein GDI1433 [Gluconacetobacter diazotrophicus PA1 5]